MKKYALLLSYVGTEFCGWQTQPPSPTTAPSIQETLEKAIAQMTQEAPSLVASGRTDAGVHASGQVAHFTLTGKSFPEYNLLRGLNTLLPPAIRILGVKEAPHDFHAQHDAVKKQYSYYVQLGPAPAAHLFPLTTFDHRALDVSAMDAGVKSLVGRFDFKPFQASDAKPGPTEREIFAADATEIPCGPPGFAAIPEIRLLRIRVIGSGFLKHMVRGIAGTALQIGAGTHTTGRFSEILRAQDRSMVGMTAPAQGLWLERVWYENLRF